MRYSERGFEGTNVCVKCGWWLLFHQMLGFKWICAKNDFIFRHNEWVLKWKLYLSGYLGSRPKVQLDPTNSFLSGSICEKSGSPLKSLRTHEGPPFCRVSQQRGLLVLSFSPVIQVLTVNFFEDYVLDWSLKEVNSWSCQPSHSPELGGTSLWKGGLRDHLCDCH